MVSKLKKFFHFGSTYMFIKNNLRMLKNTEAAIVNVTLSILIAFILIFTPKAICTKKRGNAFKRMDSRIKNRKYTCVNKSVKVSCLTFLIKKKFSATFVI